MGEMHYPIPGTATGKLELPPLPQLREPEPGSLPPESSLVKFRRYQRYRVIAPLLRRLRVLDWGDGSGDGGWSLAREAREVVVAEDPKWIDPLRYRHVRWNLRFEAWQEQVPEAEPKFDAIIRMGESTPTAPGEFLRTWLPNLKGEGVLVLGLDSSRVGEMRRVLERRFEVVEAFGQTRTAPYRVTPGGCSEERMGLLVCGPARLASALEPLLRPIGIVIPCHDNQALSDRCLRSVAQFTPEPVEIVIVDNGSTDGTSAWASELQSDFRNVRVFRNSENRGFAPAVNQGLASLPGRDVVVLHNDVLVTPGWLGGLNQVLREDATAGMAGAVSNYAPRSQLVSAPAYKDNLREMLAYSVNRSAEQAGIRREERRLSMFCALLRKELIESLGGLDERFVPLCFEDDDYTHRARMTGYRLWVAEEVYVHHVGRQASHRIPGGAESALAENWERFKTKWGITPDLALGEFIPSDKIPSTTCDPSHRQVAIPCSVSA